jgi:hypothetical protein
MTQTLPACEMCFQDWHESCPDHQRFGTCCCGDEDLDDEDDEP